MVRSNCIHVPDSFPSILTEVRVGQLYKWCPDGTLAHPQTACYMRVTDVLRRGRAVPLVVSQDTTTCRTHVNLEAHFLAAGRLVDQAARAESGVAWE